MCAKYPYSFLSENCLNNEIFDNISHTLYFQVRKEEVMWNLNLFNGYIMNSLTLSHQ